MKVQIKRKPRYANSLRNYEIELDGTIIGEIANGETKSFDITPGMHTLRMRISWARSNKVTFKAAKTDKVLRFVCESNVYGAKVFLAIIYATILSHRYIKLERID